MHDPQSTDETPSRRSWLPPWLGLVARIGVTLVLLAYALSAVEWQDREVDGRIVSGMWSVLTKADWSWWLAGMATAVLVQVVAGIRWAELARPLGFAFPRRTFVWRFFEGMFFNLCLPGSIGGDVVKAYRVGDTTPRRLLAGCSVLADRLTGLSALAVLAGAALAARKYELSLAMTLVVAAALLALVLGAFLLAVSFLDTIIAALPEGGPFRGFLSELLPYQQRPSLIAKAVAWSFVVQAGGAASVAISARALGVELPLSVWFSVVPLVALAMVLPISVGGFGVRENATAFLLAEYDVSADRAIGVALLWGLSQVAVGLVGGVLFMLDRTRDPSA